MTPGWARMDPVGRLDCAFKFGPLRLAECPFWDDTGQETTEIMRRSIHDAAAQFITPGGGLGRSAGRTRFENVSSFRVFRTRMETDRAELSSASV